MPLANEILIGRWNQLLTRLFRIAGGAPAPQLAPELMAVVDLADPPVEDRYLFDERLGWAFKSESPAAGKNCYCAFVNPYGSGQIAVLERLEFFANNGSSQTYRTSIEGSKTPPAVKAQGQPRDLRISSTMGCYIASGSDVATDFPSRIAVADHEAPAATELDQEFERGLAVLGPGDLVIVEVVAVNVGLSLTAYWRERAIEPTEFPRQGA